MAKFISNFNAKSFMSELERDVKDAILSEANERSEEILSEYVGKLINTICPGCRNTEMEVIPNGMARCHMCGYTDKVRLEVNCGQQPWGKPARH